MSRSDEIDLEDGQAAGGRHRVVRLGPWHGGGGSAATV